jgi:hypothetical protein
MVLGAVPDEEWLTECAASLQRRRASQRIQPLPLVAATTDLQRVAIGNCRAV